MKRWTIFVLFSILLSYPAVSGAIDDPCDPGKATLFSYPLVNIPIGSKGETGLVREAKGKEEAQNDPEKEKQALDKKVDDAIKKAWETK